MYLLGIESSCDDCSTCCLEAFPKKNTFRVLAMKTHSQILSHRPFGGVVPEIASRKHLETILPTLDQTLKEAKLPLSHMDAIAVCTQPGLIGSLLVGTSTAKALAYLLQKPLVPVHHLEGHLLSVFLKPSPPPITYPAIFSLISGGHCALFLIPSDPQNWSLDILKKTLISRSKDDAIGEAFDKIAKMLGFPYPGGPWIDQYAQKGDPDRFSFPRPLPQKSILDVSFSGLKTHALLTFQSLKNQKKITPQLLCDFCASFQHAIFEMLFRKIFLAIHRYQAQSLVIVGGVSANQFLRTTLKEKNPIPFYFPQMDYTTDNGAMIAAAGAIRFFQGHALSQNALLTLNPLANML